MSLGTLVILFAKMKRFLIRSPGTLSPDSSATIPTVTDNAYAAGSIDANMVGISFEPATSASEVNGELTWG